MDAKELRKKLDEGLKPDSSGKTTPIQRLTPFLLELLAHLEEQQLYLRILSSEVTSLADLPGPDALQIADHVFGKVSSDDARPVATAQSNSESDGAPKSAA